MLDEALASIYKVKTLCLKPQSARPWKGGATSNRQERKRHYHQKKFSDWRTLAFVGRPTQPNNLVFVFLCASL
jgi:hypothetical protein